MTRYERIKRQCLTLLPDPGDKVWDDRWGQGEVMHVYTLRPKRNTLVIARFGSAVYGYGSYSWWKKIKSKHVKLV